MKQGERALMGRDGLTSQSTRLQEVEARHRELDSRLKKLGKRAYLTPAEQLEASELKKRKLVAKDELVALRRAVA